MFNPVRTADQEFTLKTRVGDRGTYETKDGKTFQSYSRSPLGLAYDAYQQGVSKVDPFGETSMRASSAYGKR